MKDLQVYQNILKYIVFEKKLNYSLKRKFKKSSNTMRVTVQSNLFHIGQTIDQKKKLAKYQKDTGI